jgi:pimeloyl-ACP methyl ester carboxylesterase
MDEINMSIERKVAAFGGTGMRMSFPLVAAILALAAPAVASVDEAAPAGARNIVIVHGAFADGSGWRSVSDILTHKGYHVTVVQEPQTSLDDDVAATRAVVDAQDGPVVLVGHSYGGSVISVAGAQEKVKALVYVAAFVPDVGESLLQLAATKPAASQSIVATRDGRLFFDPAKYGADFAADVPADQARFMAQSQVWPAQAAFNAKASAAAWRERPSYGIVATEDRNINPDLQRWMYRRAGAKVAEIKGSHALFIPQAEAVAAVIEEAAANAK